MKPKLNVALGAQFSLLYCVCTAFSLTLISDFEQRIPPLLLAFLTFFFTIVCFHLFSSGRYQHLWLQFRQNKKLFLKANVYTVFIWALSFIGLKDVPPAIGGAIFFGTMPIATLLLQHLKKHKRACLSEVFIAMIILLTLVALTLDSTSAINSTYILSAVMMFLAGVAGAMYNVMAKEFSQNKIKANTVMAHRFWGMLIVSAVYVLCNPATTIMQFNWFDVDKAFLIAVISSMIPLYFLQKALEKVSAQLVSYFIGCVPILVYVVQQCIMKFPLLLSQLLLICVLAICLMGVTFINVKNAQKA